MKFCPKCGTHMEDHFTFCPTCGLPQPAAPAEQPNPFAPREYTPMPEGGHYYISTGGGNKKKTIAIIAAVVVVIALVAVLAIVVFNPDAAAKRTVKAFFKANNDLNTEKIADLVAPKSILEKEDMDKEDLIDNIEDAFESDDFPFGNDWEYTDLKIQSVKDLSKNDFEKMQELYQEEYDMKISDAKRVKIHYTVISEDGDEKGTDDCLVYKYKGRWYLDLLL